MTLKTLVIGSDPTDLQTCREATENLAAKAGFSQREVDGIVCAVCEAYANAVVHGRKNGAIRITLSLKTDDESLQAVVCDDGSGFSCPRETDMPPPWANRGRGIPLMRAFMDDVKVESGSGCCVTLTKYRRKVWNRMNHLR